MCKGVSIVVCCHNSTSVLSRTLAYIQEQTAQQKQTPWEVIVIDNASTDGTAKLAETLWPENPPAPLTIVSEPRLGLSFARQRGFDEARYSVVSFVDDDNWVAPDWVEKVSKAMVDHPEVGACGGDSEPVFESAPPWWFDLFKTSYAIGRQGKISSDVSDTRGYLWGAGLTFRKDAWRSLCEIGYQPLLVGRKGSALSSGEDSELCFAIMCSGWRLRYESDLRLKHFIPENRLNWKYLRKLHRGFGSSQLILDIYKHALNGRDPESRQSKWIRQKWLRKAIYLALELYRRRKDFIRTLAVSSEGDPEILVIEFLLGQLLDVFRLRGNYDKAHQQILGRSWSACGNNNLA